MIRGRHRRPSLPNNPGINSGKAGRRGEARDDKVTERKEERVRETFPKRVFMEQKNIDRSRTRSCVRTHIRVYAYMTLLLITDNI